MFAGGKALRIFSSQGGYCKYDLIIQIIYMEHLDSLEHLELNGKHGVHRPCDKGTNHVTREWIL